MAEPARKEIREIISKRYAHATVKLARRAEKRFELEFIHVT
jgi:hypothetical protein